MPLYMDVHIVPGVKAKDVAEAHRRDMLIQEEHACKCMTYWIDEERENVFCLIDAPNKEAVSEMHGRAHGLIPHRIIEVSPAIVESFLGRIYDPATAETTEDGLKVFHDPSYRIVLLVKHHDPVLLRQELGNENANAVLQQLTGIFRSLISKYDGREVQSKGYVGSFTSARNAVSFAYELQKEIEAAGLQNIYQKTVIHGGEPVSNSDDIFGDTIRFANYISSTAGSKKIIISSAVRELVSKEFNHNDQPFHTLHPNDESLLDALFRKLEEHWTNENFSVTEYCQVMAMSKSQLYRKTIEFFGLSPNLLIKDYRLERAKELLQKGLSVSQVTFDSGFSSPSYFTKCFKKKYSMLPASYLELAHV